MVRLVRRAGWNFACLLSVCCLSQAALAQAPRAAPLSAAIAAQPLPQALAAFIRATHLQLVYVSQLALGKQSGAVAAGLSAPESLARLLDGTGLEFTFLNDHTVQLFEPHRAAAGVPQTAPDAPPPAAVEALAEVVVSANKRDEPLGAVPMSISVLSAERLSAAGIANVAGIAAVTPGVDYQFSSQYGPGILTNLAIRGISADKGDATTGIYVDDTPIQTPHTPFGNALPVNFDLARVEVLRGPQGVLFGRGAEGGAIRFVTNQPSTTTFSQAYRADLSTTQNGDINAEAGAAVGGPLIDGRLGGRVSVWHRSDGGYVSHVDPFTGATLDGDANRSHTEALRVSLAVEPNEALRITPAFSYQTTHLHDTPVFYAYLSQPNAGLLDNGRLLRQPSDDRFSVASLNVEERLEGVRLTSISAYFQRAAAATVDSTNAAGAEFFNGFGNPLGPAYPTSYADAVPSLLTLNQFQFTEELRLASAGASTPLTWLAGLFYSRLRQDATQDTYAVSDPANPGILTDGHTIVTEISAFGVARAAVSSRWSLGAGVRLGWIESKSEQQNAGFVNAGSAPFTHGDDRQNLPPTPRFDLSYQPDGRNLFYVAAAKGFRNGGSNASQPVFCGNAAYPTTFGPDSVWSFEIGSKSSLFEHRLQLDASIYDIRWNGIQERIYDDCGHGYTANVGAAASSGFDLSADVLISARLRLALSLGYIDVHYTRTLLAPGGAVLVDQGAVVGGVPSVPAPWSGTMTARYDWPLADGSAVYLRGEDVVHSHNPGPFTELDPKFANYDPRLRADAATNLLNLQLGYTRSGRDIRLCVSNALNSLPTLQSYSDAPGSTLIYAYTYRPRTVGVSGSWTF